MKEKTKDSLKVLGNFLGYGSVIGLAIANGYLLYKIKKHKRIYFHEPSKLVLYTELVALGSILTFSGYKLAKSIRDIVY